MDSVAIDVGEAAQVEVADYDAREEASGGPVATADELVEELHPEEEVVGVQEAVDEHELADQVGHVEQLREQVEPHEAAPEPATCTAISAVTLLQYLF